MLLLQKGGPPTGVGLWRVRGLQGAAAVVVPVAAPPCILLPPPLPTAAVRPRLQSTAEGKPAVGFITPGYYVFTYYSGGQVVTDFGGCMPALEHLNGCLCSLLAGRGRLAPGQAWLCCPHCHFKLLRFSVNPPKLPLPCRQLHLLGVRSSLRPR